MAEDNERVKYWENPATEAQTIMRVTKRIKASGGANDPAALGLVDEAIEDTSGCLLMWAKAAATAEGSSSFHDDEPPVFPPELLSSCCKYMEALATARPAYFSTACQSLARHVADIFLARASRSASTSANNEAFSTTGVDATEQFGTIDEQNSPASGIPLSEELDPTDDDDNLTLASDLVKRKELELWADMLGMCLLPFCTRDTTARKINENRAQEASDEFDSESDEDEEEGSVGDGFADGKARSGWVAGWMRRAGASSTGAEPLKCPFDVREGGEDAGFSSRLASVIVSHTKAAADRSRPGIVSSLAAVLEVLCAFTATEGHPCESHAKVVHDAFFCLTGLAEAVPESSAGAECVKAALVALKGCAEAARLPPLGESTSPALLVLEGVPDRLKMLLTRLKSQDPKAFSTARSFCREALDAAVACSRTLIRRAGAAIVTLKPQWFLREFVVTMASPLLLGDAVEALITARTGKEDISAEALRVLRDNILPGGVERLTKALGSVDRYSASAAKDVIKATAWLVEAAQGEVLPYRDQLGIAVVKCATSDGRARNGALGKDERLRLCFRAISGLCAATASAAPARGRDVRDALATDTTVSDAGCSAKPSSSTSIFAEAALELVSGIVEREWLGKKGVGVSGEKANAVAGDDDLGESIITVVEAHVTLVAILRSGMHVPGISPDGEWPPCAKRLGKLAWAFAYRMRKAGSSGPSHLADDDVMLLCQGAEVLEAVAECSGSFFCGHEKLSFFEGDLLQVLTAIRNSHDKSKMHPVVYEACSWVQATS